MKELLEDLEETLKDLCEATGFELSKCEMRKNYCAIEHYPDDEINSYKVFIPSLGEAIAYMQGCIFRQEDDQIFREELTDLLDGLRSAPIIEGEMMELWKRLNSRAQRTVPEEREHRYKETCFKSYAHIEQQKLDLKVENKNMKLLMAGILLSGYNAPNLNMISPHHRAAIKEVIGNLNPEELTNMINTGEI